MNQGQTNTVEPTNGLKPTQTAFTSAKVSTHACATELVKTTATQQSTSAGSQAYQSLTSMEIGIIACTCVAFVSIVLFILLFCTRHPKSSKLYAEDWFKKYITIFL